MVVKKPYYEVIKGNNRFRLIAENSESDELVWHRDRHDRIVEIIKSNGWKFQFDDELPMSLDEGDSLYIPAKRYHRVIKGTGDLIIRIQES